MTAYELMIKANHHLIKGGELNAKQRENIVLQLLKARSSPEQAARFYTGVRYPGNRDRMYPVYFIPPYNEGKKLKTLMTVTPKTHILSANSYELEIIRLLHLLAPENPEVCDMVEDTLMRLHTTCFATNCGHGECFETSGIVLRFLATCAPQEREWMQTLIALFHRHFEEKRRHSGTKWYFWLCLSELPMDIAEPEILRFKDEILTQLNRSCVMNSEHDRITHPMLMCVIRNVIARLPEFEYIKAREPYVSEKDGRLRFDMSEGT